MPDVQAVIFDVGQTLIHYKNPLNWQGLYSGAIRGVMADCGMEYSAAADEGAQGILTKYNTRVNFREHEVSSDTIFSEVLEGWGVELGKLSAAKRAFYGYFQADAECFEDTEMVLRVLKERGVKVGALTDVAYGMDNEYALRDLLPIEKYIDICLTSTDVGFRKPNTAGYLQMQQAFDIPSRQIAFVGDEEKDVQGANSAGMISVLVNRGEEEKNFGQKYTIKSLSQILRDVMFI
ncbi:MAG: HAD family hydrolase [Defluviitaleaceae bacterium]|nr:HAD family hydrolase [Defluviitaleaceae bacterium]